MTNMTNQNKKIAVAYSAQEERLNTITHGIGALLSMVGLLSFVVITVEQNDFFKLITHSIYGISLCLLFGASTLYHGATSVSAKSFYKLLDHCAIYLQIAGTYTPLLLHIIPGVLGNSVLALIWILAILGIFVKMRFGSQFKKFSVATYLVMGWLSMVVIYQLIQSLPAQGLFLLGLGGVIYSSGVYFYLNDKIKNNHAIWHIFVLLAALCHYFLIFFYVLPNNIN